ncbi:hypothetical protein AFB00_28275 [Pseudonocardia sp. HH130630-07]|nr:hypothetical protein AFB00_28275 [Pseudonocardia sp. HH130630-07]
MAGVTGIGVVAGTATAAGSGTCTSSVNVRSEPSETAPIVGVCERGETTSVGEAEDGFVELPEYGGWAVADYVSTSGATAPNTRSSEDVTSPRGTDGMSSAERSASPTTGSMPRSSTGSTERSSSPESSADPSATPERSSSPSIFSEDDED